MAPVFLSEHLLILTLFLSTENFEEASDEYFQQRNVLPGILGIYDRAPA